MSSDAKLCRSVYGVASFRSIALAARSNARRRHDWYPCGFHRSPVSEGNTSVESRGRPVAILLAALLRRGRAGGNPADRRPLRSPERPCSQLRRLRRVGAEGGSVSATIEKPAARDGCPGSVGMTAVQTARSCPRTLSPTDEQLIG